MGLFRGRKARTAAGAVISDRSASKDDLAALKAFADSRTGVEAYVEPQTSVTQTTLLLVAHDGESIRRRVASPAAAADFARRKLKIPVYDVNLVGLPPRKREYDLRQAKVHSGAAPSSAPRTTPRETAAIMVLETIAGVDPLPDSPPRELLERTLRTARAKAHPDRTGGDRSRWDKVEGAARALGLD